MTLHLSLVCVLFMLQYFCLSKDCAAYFTLSLSPFFPLFLHSHLFSHFCPLSYIFFFLCFFTFSFSVLVFILSCSLLSDISLQSTTLLYLPLGNFSPHFSFAHCRPASFLLTSICTHICAYMCPHCRSCVLQLKQRNN